MALLVATTVTPGSTPPVESATRPAMPPRNVWAPQTPAIPKIRRNTKAGRRFDEDMYAPPERDGGDLLAQHTPEQTPEEPTFVSGRHGAVHQFRRDPTMRCAQHRAWRQFVSIRSARSREGWHLRCAHHECERGRGNGDVGLLRHGEDVRTGRQNGAWIVGALRVGQAPVEGVPVVDAPLGRRDDAAVGGYRFAPFASARFRNPVLAASCASSDAPDSANAVRSNQTANIRSSAGTRNRGRRNGAVAWPVHSMLMIPSVCSREESRSASSGPAAVAGSHTAIDGLPTSVRGGLAARAAGAPVPAGSPGTTRDREASPRNAPDMGAGSILTLAHASSPRRPGDRCRRRRLRTARSTSGTPTPRRCARFHRSARAVCCRRRSVPDPRGTARQRHS